MARRIAIAVSLFMFLFVLGAAALLWHTWGKMQEWSARIYVPLDKTVLHEQTEPAFIRTAVQGAAEPLEEPRIDSRRPFALLLIGVDERRGDRGRADALIVAVVNPQKPSTIMISIPRDTRTKLAGDTKQHEDKINHAYAFDGVPGTVATVEALLGIPIDYYIQVNMQGFQQVIDVLGGVQIHNDMAFEYEGYAFEEGRLDLTGEEALAYVRMRYDDPKGDIGRSNRQKAVVEAALQHAIGQGSIRLITDIFEQLTHHVTTNITFEDWRTLVLHYRDAAQQIQMEQISGHGTMLSGIYYYLVSDEERARLTALLHEQLAFPQGRDLHQWHG